jgi:LacI family transcriptional regulator
MKNNKVTLTDIANELSVSKTLVSMVLNGKGNANSINKDTQEKVFNKAKELKYKPNQLARGLRMGKTKTIGLLVADISNPFFARITRTIERYAEKEGYSLIVCSSDEDQERERKLIRMLINRQVDGIIMTSTLEHPDLIEEMISDNFPLVLFDRYFNNMNVNYVGVDNVNAAKKAVNHFIENGHKNIALITLTPNYISSLKDRKQGYLEAIEQSDIEVVDKYILELDYRDLKDKQYNQIKDFIFENKEISSIFTTNNSLATGCMEAIRELGLKIPKDISLITFDDVELFKFTSPALTSIAQPLEEIGRKTVSALLDQFKTGVSLNKKEVLEAHLIIRES